MVTIRTTLILGRWTLTHYEKPWTANIDKTLHFQERGRRVAEWRHAFAVLAREARLTPQERIAVTVQPHYRRQGGKWPDPASCSPAAKAAIDGLVDAKVITDDGPRQLAWVKFLPPVMGAERDALALMIEVAS